MTKEQGESLVKRLSDLEKAVIVIQEELELNKLGRPCYTVKEAAKILKVTPKTIYNLVERGELESLKLGCLRIKGDSLRRCFGMYTNGKK